MVEHKWATRRGRLLGVSLTLAWMACAGSHAATWYVASGSASGEGSSWASAFPTISAAMAVAQPGDAVWVAGGGYVENVAMAPGVALLGGFAGDETAAAQRNPRAHLTLLNGGAKASTIAVPPGAPAGTVIDGFTLINGLAKNGGGISIGPNASPFIAHNIIAGNATLAGPGMGGAIYSDAGSPTVADNLIVANASDSGPAIAFNGGAATIVNNTIVNNIGDLSRGAVILSGASVLFADNIVSGNSGSGVVVSAPAGLTSATTGARTVFHNNCVYGNTDFNQYDGTADPTGAKGNISVDPGFTSTPGSRFQLRSTSPCRDAGNAADTAGVTLDLAGNSRVQGGSVDIGAFEYEAHAGDLAFLAQPHGDIGSPFNPALSVALLDESGNPVASFSGTVNITIVPGTGNPNANLIRTTMAVAVNGVASFPGLGVDRIGTGYILRAEADGIAPAYSFPFDVLRKVYYVKPGGDDAQDGSSWSTAFQTVRMAANAAARTGGDIWVAAGTYTGTVTLKPGVRLYGGFAGTETLFTDRNWTANATVLDGGHVGPVIAALTPGEDPIAVDGFTIRNGVATDGAGLCGTSLPGSITNNTFTGNQASRNGGAICWTDDPAPDITGNTFTGNTALRGGAVYATSSPLVSGNTFQFNAAAEGGALYTDDVPLINGNTFLSNTAQGTGSISATGGAICVAGGSPSILSNTIRNNTATGGVGGGVGGGIALRDTSANLRMNTIAGNQAGRGGGLSASRADQASISANRVNGNAATTDGGGMEIELSSISLTDNEITSNTAGGYGGGLDLRASPRIALAAWGTRVVNNTLALNTSQADGGGVSARACSAPLMVNNLIVANSSGLYAETGTSVTLRNADIFGNTGYATAGGGTMRASGVLSADPLFGGSANGDFHLRAGSPAIDAGDDGVVPQYDRDADGYGRIMLSHVDLGAHEAGGAGPARVYVSVQPIGGSAGTPLAGQPSVAIQTNNGTLYNGPVTISIRPGTGTANAVLSGDTTITCVNSIGLFRNLSIDRAGSGYVLSASAPGFTTMDTDPITIHAPLVRVSPAGSDTNDGASWASARRTIQAAVDIASETGGAVWVAAGTYDGPVRMLPGCSLLGGFAGTETQASQRNPGANVTIIDAHGTDAVVQFTDPTLPSTVLDGFLIRGGNGPDGTGGVLCQGASPAVSNCIIAGNAGRGVSLADSSAALVNDLIAHNAAAGPGVAVYSVGDGAAPTLVNNTIAGNAGTDSAVYLSGGTATLANNIIALNGAGLEADAASPPVLTLDHNDIAGNAAFDMRNVPATTSVTGALASDPLFENAVGGNYRLSAASPCIAAGDDTLVTWTKDLAGQPRITGAHVDLGAYAFSQPKPPLATAVKALRIAGGLDIGKGSDVYALNAEDAPPSDGRLDLLDALTLLRQADGL